MASLDYLSTQGGPDLWLIPLEWLPKHRDKFVPVPENFLAKQNLPSPSPRLFSFRRSSPTPGNATIYSQIYVPVTADDNIVDNQVITLPLSVDTLGLFTNPLLLETKGVTTPLLTWEAIVEVVKKLTKRSNLTITEPVIALGTSNNVSRASDILATLMIQNHTPMVNSQKNEALFNQTVIKATDEPVQAGELALDFYTSFASPTKETFTWNGTLPNDFDYFAAGKLPLLIDYSFRVRDLLQKTPGFQFGTSPLPQIAGASREDAATLATAQMIGVTLISQHQGAAWDFIKFLTRGDNSLTYARASGRPPARLELLDGPGFDPRLQPFLAQLPIAKSWYRNDVNKTDRVFRQAIDAVLAGQPIPDVIGRLTKQTTHILRNEAYE